MRNLFRDMSNRQRGSVGPLAFVTLFRSLFPQFNQKDPKTGHYAQQDADEAYTTLLELLSRRFANQGVHKLFAGELISSYKCLEAPDEPLLLKKEVVFKLSCNIGNETAFLMAGLKDSMRETLLKHSDSLKRDARYERQSQISKLPFYLTVQFVRFFWRQDVKAKTKIVRPVEFPNVLDLFELCTDDLKQQLKPRREQLIELEAKKLAEQKLAKAKGPAAPEPSQEPTQDEPPKPIDQWVNTSGRYELVGVVSHKGRSADGGHYIGWVRDKGERWIKFDDEDASFVPEDEIKKLSGKGGADWSIAYLLLYRAL